MDLRVVSSDGLGEGLGERRGDGRGDGPDGRGEEAGEATGLRCERTWRRLEGELANLLSHCGHANGLSPECARSWRRSDRARRKASPHDTQR